MLTEDYAESPEGEFGAVDLRRRRGGSGRGRILGDEHPRALGSCFLLLLFGVVVMLDMVRNIWSWDANLALNDSLLDSLLGLFGLS